MRASRVILLSLASLLLAVAAYNACSQPSQFTTVHGSTQIGNPMAPTAQGILFAVCSTITRCQANVTLSQCQAGVLASSGIDYQLGLPQGTYPTFSSVVDAETSGLISGNASFADFCIASVTSLDCADPRVTGSYNPNLANPFSGAPALLTPYAGSCGGVFSVPPATNDYYVSTTGSDTTGDGSLAKPWATITHAAQAFTPGPGGATVHVDAGIYAPPAQAVPSFTSAGVYTHVSGTASARVRFVSDVPRGARITTTGAYTAWYNTGAYVDIIGFDVSGDGAVGIENDGSYTRVTGNHVHNIPGPASCSAGGAGISTWYTANYTEITGNWVDHIGATGSGGCPSGIKHEGYGGLVDNNIVNNVVTGPGIYLWHAATHVTVANNLTFQNVYGIYNGAGDAPGGVINDYTSVVNNIAAFNTFGAGYGIFESGSTGTHNVYSNNLIFGNTINLSLQNGLTAVNTVSLNPAFVNYQAGGGGDYHLVSTSPAVNAGLATGAPGFDFENFPRPSGSAFDIGPYEFH